MNEERFIKLIEPYQNVSIADSWKSSDVRPDRKNEYWLNVIIKKE